MAYELDDFVADCRGALSADNGADGREQVRKDLEKLLHNAAFVEAACGDDAEPGIHELYRDPDLGFVVLAHINEKGRTSPPHDHGESWAVYGQAKGFTDMTEYERRDDGSTTGEAEVVKTNTYRLEPGSAGMFGPRAIHSIHFPDDARFVRVTGTDLGTISTRRFDMSAKTVTEVEPSEGQIGAGGVAV
jgi:predicted metal-dependent enzyme (double-stranded beta helix superfamily)